MEGRIRSFLLNAALALPLLGAGLGSAPLRAQQAPAAVQDQVIQPEVERREVVPPRIDTEDFEVGAFVGLMSVEDFGVNTGYGVRLAYHISEDLFVEAVYGQTKVGETSYERLSGAARLLTDDERELRYYNLSLGYNVLPGEAFFGRRTAFTTALYLIGGVGSTDFAGDSRFTVNFGAGFRLLPTDWVAVRAEVRDHMFDMDLLGDSKTTHNIDVQLGVTFFF